MELQQVTNLTDNFYESIQQLQNSSATLKMEKIPKMEFFLYN